jgi:hypothetical protein
MISRSENQSARADAFCSLAVLGLLAFVLLCSARIPVLACGYHEGSPAARQGALNWVYPNSLHVRGAIWQAQAAGEVPTADAASFQKTERVLQSLSVRLGKLTPADRLERFSVVLVETVLWSQFTLTGSQSKVDVDVDGPLAGHLVVVTDDPVLYALEKGMLTLSMAVNSGLVKLYGQQEQVSNFLELYGTVGG